jgi:hypothetical protein
MTLALTILGLLAKYLPLGIAAIKVGVAEFDTVHATAANIHAAAANPTEGERVAAEAEIAKLETLLNRRTPSA